MIYSMMYEDGACEPIAGDDLVPLYVMCADVDGNPVKYWPVDREALLTVADEMDKLASVMDRDMPSRVLAPDVLGEFVLRIREACGEVDGR